MDYPDSSSSRSSIRDIRDRVLRELQRASKIDLQDGRCRFIPRGALLSILSYRQVREYLESTAIHGDLEARSLEDIAHYISPEGKYRCHCQDVLCTGARAIFASLLHIEKGELIGSFYAVTGSRICDKNLPFQDDMSCQDDMPCPVEEEHFHTPLQELLPIEKELFHHFQWQLRSPYLEKLNGKEKHMKLNSEVVLPWESFQNDVSDDDETSGQPAHVIRVQIYDDHHNLVRIFP